MRDTAIAPEALDPTLADALARVAELARRSREDAVTTADAILALEAVNCAASYALQEHYQERAAFAGDLDIPF